MALIHVLLNHRLLLFSHLIVLLLFVLTRKVNGQSVDCPDYFDCGNLGLIQYPFTKVGLPNCGALAIQGCDDLNKTAAKRIQLVKGVKHFQVTNIDNSWSRGKTISIIDQNFTKILRKNACEAFNYDNIPLPPPPSPFGFFYMKDNITVFKCNRNQKLVNNLPNNFFKNSTCPYYDFYFGDSISYDESNNSFTSCSSFHLPINELGFALSSNPFPFLVDQITFQFVPSNYCEKCYLNKKDHCRFNSNKQIYCPARKGRNSRWKLKLGLILGLGIGPWIIVGLFLTLRYYKRKHSPANVQSQTSYDVSVDPHRNREIDKNILFFGVPVFSYEELQQATNNFDSTRRLGDGGFGIVYYGKLKDGREVAVKHLFEHNYKRLEQFVNEIEVITRLRHRNLVSLYGCTSRHSRELLLVYEYIPNGTVASHLHGDLARAGLLTWPIRMQIAIETASALAYLHASDIIHRDVKTNNILLDINFSVKVADFGLSRFFSNNVSHVSTAPQGSPGYLDPEYFQLYKLSAKSDVYSFGVVLVELISSMAAIDAGREREEINLANLAVKKIRTGAIGELVDPSLGFESDSEVKRMVTLVAELAFQCLLGNMELRPSMDQVLQELKKIDGGNYEFDQIKKVYNSVGSSRSEEVYPPIVGTTVNKKQDVSSSPKSLIEKWKSQSTTPNASG